MMDTFFLKTTLNRFRLRAIFYCAAMDFVILAYIHSRFTSFPLFKEKFDHLMLLQQIGPGIIPSSEVEALFIKFKLLTNILLVTFALFHASIYFFFWQMAKKAWQYVSLLSTTGMVLVPLSVLISVLQGNKKMLPFLLVFFIYAYVAFGIRYFKKQPELQEKLGT